MLGLSHLLPYDPAVKKEGELKKALQEYKLLILSSIQALTTLQDKDLEKFDALVGENACHIRATKIILIVSEGLSHIDELLKELTLVQEKINELGSSDSINKLMRAGVSLRDLLDLNHLDVRMSENDLFCVKSFILYVMKGVVSDGNHSLCKESKLSPKKLWAVLPGVSAAFLEKLANKLRSLLSFASAEFMKSSSRELECPFLEKLFNEHTVVHKEKFCTPTFWTFKALLMLAQKKSIPFKLQAKFIRESSSGYRYLDEETLFFKPCKIGNKYIQVDSDDINSNTPIFMLEGAVHLNSTERLCKESWKRNLASYSFEEVILAFAAAHRQYPNPHQAVDVQDDQYDYYVSLAEKGGFSTNNASALMIQHMYSVFHVQDEQNKKRVV